MLTLTYIAMAVLGCGYILSTILLGHGGDLEADAGGHDLGVEGHGDGDVAYGIDSSGHGSTSEGHTAAPAFHFPLFSPLALATTMASIGAYGLIAERGFGLGEAASLLVAIPAALATTWLVSYGGFRLMHSSRGSSQIKVARLIGSRGEVITPIPAGGVGEVAAIVDGQRFSSSAREASGAAVPRGADVTVVRMVGHTVVVKLTQAGEGGA